MKSKILGLFRSTPEIVSGETLSAALGISRVSVWKHIQKLQESGYEIEATPRGYQLLRSPDTPFPWEFPQREGLIHYFPEVSSTMDIAKEMARKGASHFSVVVAGRQLSGRGRLRRTWHSNYGGLYFTLILRPGIPLQWGFRVNFAASLALCRTIRDMTGLNAAVKWPNDILIDGKKLSGMLSEMEAEAEMVSFITVGIGINVNNDPTEYEPNSCSLRQLLGKPISRKEILARFLDALQAYLDAADDNLEKTIAEWKQLTCTLGRRVSVITPLETSTGLALDIDSTGALILELSDGSHKRVLYGDCMNED
ncbi:MAG: biotin--[acetyl-CoA-carboxylase] ligase [Deltaproteobacteria bacterium]|nr:biotin--[acetyl-CoA-carboxylase] ligase [Deltaproteobacteria bacterium]